MKTALQILITFVLKSAYYEHTSYRLGRFARNIPVS
jgi:hypothetical protein